MGHKLTAVEIADLFKRIDSDGNGEIEFDEFAQIMSEPARVCSRGRAPRATPRPPPGRRMQKDEWLESMRAAFASFDKDGSGSISVEELREVLVENLGQQVSDDELDRLVKLADANGDGEIDFDEFKALMHTEQIVTGHE
jgi:calmodulin